MSDRIRYTSVTRVLEIKTRVKNEGCYCEYTNPHGSCFLAEDTWFVNQGMKRYAGVAARSPEVQAEWAAQPCQSRTAAARQPKERCRRMDQGTLASRSLGPALAAHPAAVILRHLPQPDAGRR